MIPFVLGLSFKTREFLPTCTRQALTNGEYCSNARIYSEATEGACGGWAGLEVEGIYSANGPCIVGYIDRVKKMLPAEGVRWRYMRTVVKRVENGRMDMQVLLFDEKMGLVAVSHQDAQIIPAAGKNQKL
jgi:hypothetical protein